MSETHAEFITLENVWKTRFRASLSMFDSYEAEFWLLLNLRWGEVVFKISTPSHQFKFLKLLPKDGKFFTCVFDRPVRALSYRYCDIL